MYFYNVLNIYTFIAQQKGAFFCMWALLCYIIKSTSVIILLTHYRLRTQFIVNCFQHSHTSISSIQCHIECFYNSLTSLFSHRLTELTPVKIDPYWGIISKCLVYSKAASDPFVYSLLRQQYKKALFELFNRILGRDSYTLSGSPSDMENECCSQRGK